MVPNVDVVVLSHHHGTYPVAGSHLCLVASGIGLGTARRFSMGHVASYCHHGSGTAYLPHLAFRCPGGISADWGFGRQHRQASGRVSDQSRDACYARNVSRQPKSMDRIGGCRVLPGNGDTATTISGAHLNHGFPVPRSNSVPASSIFIPVGGSRSARLSSLLLR